MNPLEALAPFVLDGALVVLAVMICVSFFRALIGPRMSDRIVGINMIGTQAIILICCLVVLLDEGWLVDVAIVYAMFSFLAVVVLTKMDIGVYREWRAGQRMQREREALEKQEASEAAKAPKKRTERRRRRQQ